jgi:alpha-L-rhamnosidase
MFHIRTAAPTGLSVEHLGEPIGITVCPRMSWRLPNGASRQSAYRIRAGGWDSGRVASGRSLLVPYGGPPLRSGEQVTWTVKVWTDAGESDWSAPAAWEMGLLDAGDWTARWIRPRAEDAIAGTRPHPVWTLRGHVEFDAPVGMARLRITAEGIYEAFLNGRRVGDQELTPGFTSYDATLQVQTFDVTDHLQAGVNELEVALSGGWITWTRRYRGTPLSLLAQLEVHGVDGSVVRWGTGPDWESTRRAARTADLIQGETADLRAPESRWEPVIVGDGDLVRLRGSDAPPVRRVEELRPRAITSPAPGRHVVDFGQNINGWARLADLGPAGTELVLTHGESLGSDGGVRAVTWSAPDPEPFQQDRVVSGGRAGEAFEPRHTTHGFRYLQVDGHPGPLEASDVTAVVVHTDLRRTGWFSCGDERVDRLHEAAVWSFRGNACDIPTDCPTRERAGWTGDWQIFVRSAAYLYDVAGFSSKWLRDLATDQQVDGVVWHCAPNAEHAEFYTTFPPGAAGFGDAAVIVPWELYLAYGDADLLERQWPSMTAWIDYAAGRARAARHPSRIAARPVPAPHEEFLWDTGFHWGEWNEPGMLPPDAGPEEITELVAGLSVADHGNVATAYLHHSACLLSRIARILGKDDDAARFDALAGATRAAWQAEFLGPDGAIRPATQAGYVRALEFDLVPEELRAPAADRLARLVRDAGVHLATGFLSTPYLLPVLAENGHPDLAYDLLLQDSEPSWLTMIDRGATTIWELWDGIDAHGNARESLNHYSKGSVVTFLHRYIAGIRPIDGVPAYERFRIEPLPDARLGWAAGALETPYGRIESSWRIEGGRLRLEVLVPPGTAAEVRLPDGSGRELGPGRERLECPFPAAAIRP